MLTCTHAFCQQCIDSWCVSDIAPLPASCVLTVVCAGENGAPHVPCAVTPSAILTTSGCSPLWKRLTPTPSFLSSCDISLRRVPSADGGFVLGNLPVC